MLLVDQASAYDYKLSRDHMPIDRVKRANPARNHDHVHKQVVDPLVQSSQVFKPN